MNLQEISAKVRQDKHWNADPVTQKPFVYIPDGKNYKLCADFTLATVDYPANRSNEPLMYETLWKHNGGYYCFDLSVPQPVKNSPG